ncbi:sigma-70 family RNA polymerase sigma factor [Gloeocapsa sp. PCC 73106]|uniref:sigma-70 family RNA polymerase sigma factor n=1 Tax=Gloeocapsa sp. PCC 73106 TaxID=102232 RepID=UPI00130EDA90|nr:sigma-70 family RNA polymerase sigma factor [Gloeocapsa sp. PCC 73106]
MSNINSINELISAYLQNDRQSGAKLFDSPEYQRKFKALVAKYAYSSNISSEDLSQTAKLKIIQALKAGKYNPDLGDFHHWSLTVARFAIIDLVRKNQRQSKVISLDQNIPGTDIPVGDTVADDFNSLESLEQAESVIRVKSLIFSLDERYPERNYRKLFLAKVAGKTQKEIALELNITQSAISKRWKELTVRLTEEMQLVSEFLSEQKPAKSQRSQAQW